MEGGTNDNEPTWITLSAATEKVLGKPNLENRKDGADKNGDATDGKDDEDQRDRIAEGVRNIERFEAGYRTRR